MSTKYRISLILTATNTTIKRLKLKIIQLSLLTILMIYVHH